MDEKELKSLVEKILGNMIDETNTNKEKNENQSAAIEALNNKSKTLVDNDGCIDDITKVDIRKQLLVDDPKDAKKYLEMKSKTPARIGVGRSGPRYKTETVLRFRADHAAAQDAVFSYVDENFIKENNLFEVETLCKDKDQYLTRPDLGRRFSNETIKLIKEKLGTNQKVLMMVGDGLSSAAIEANLKDTIQSIKQGLKMYGIEIGQILFVKHCRVGAMDQLGEELGCDVVCMLIGERPGLVTAESMSAYIAYKPNIGLSESKRTVISNIHKEGTSPVEAGAHISELIKTMLEKKASGIDLKM